MAVRIYNASAAGGVEDHWNLLAPGSEGEQGGEQYKTGYQMSFRSCVHGQACSHTYNTVYVHMYLPTQQKNKYSKSCLNGAERD